MNKNKKHATSFFLLLGSAVLWGSGLGCVSVSETVLNAYPKKAVVIETADIRSLTEPRAAGYAHDDRQLTQVVAGEIVEVQSTQADWARVRCLEQPFNEKEESYPGWMRLSQLDFSGNTTFKRVPIALFKTETGPDEMAIRHRIVEAAAALIGRPYLWGGRSEEAVDCSGLTSLAYWKNDLIIPRDTGPLFSASRPVARAVNLLPGDFIFFSSTSSAQVTHVMLYAGKGQAIEAPETGKTVRRVVVVDRLHDFQKPSRRRSSFPSLKDNDRIGARTIYFRRIFPQRNGNLGRLHDPT